MAHQLKRFRAHIGKVAVAVVQNIPVPLRKIPVQPAEMVQNHAAGLAVCQRKRQRIRNVLLRILRQKQLLNLCRKGFESVGLRRTGGDKQAKQKTEQDDPRAIFQVNPSIKAFLVKQRMRNGKYCRSSAKTAT